MAEIIVIHGVPGAGKSTHSENLARSSLNNCPIFHISAGNRIRAIRNGEIESRHSKSEINEPNMPEHRKHVVVNEIVFEFIAQCPPNSIVLVDGYPRYKDAVGPFIDTIREGDHVLLGCVNLNISLETCVSRLSGRGVRRGERIGGITSNIIEKRYQEHLTYTTDAVSALEKVAPVITIEAEFNEQVVWKSFNEAIRGLINSQWRQNIF